jgi:Tol biopolymer transport system component
VEVTRSKTRDVLKTIMKKMKSNGSWPFLAVVFGCLLITGCVSRQIAWSPDGAHAAIFAGDGLHLCGPDGVLSEIVLPGEGMAEWSPDSHRLAIVSEVGKQSWKDLEKVISPEERERVVEGGKALLAQFKAGRNLTDALNTLNGLGGYERDAVAVYLAQKEGTQEQAGTNWANLRQKEASLIQIRIGTLEEGKLALGPPLLNSLRKVFDLRVAPTETAIAFTAEGNREGELQLWVLAADGSAPPQLVAKNTAVCSDWSVDGHSLVYIRAINTPPSDDQISLGSLTRRGILNAAGKIQIQTKADDLAGLLFAANNKVRCLSDGRIVFASADIHLPCTALDMPQQPQLFALDPEREAGVIPLIPRSVQGSLPTKPAFYEISPDGKRVAVFANNGAVVVLTLATGAVDTVQAAGGVDTASAPAWRSASELCFVSSTNGQPAQVALWNNGTTRVLSANWPAEARNGFLDK